MKICPKCLCPDLATGHMCAKSMRLNEEVGQPPPPSMVEIDHGPVAPRLPKPITGCACSFCGLTVKDKKLVAGPATTICEDCIVLCADIVGYRPLEDAGEIDHDRPQEEFGPCCGHPRSAHRLTPHNACTKCSCRGFIAPMPLPDNIGMTVFAELADLRRRMGSLERFVWETVPPAVSVTGESTGWYG